MKKCLIIFTIAILSIIPISSVKALDVTLKDNTIVTIPDFPDDGNDGHIVYINTSGYYHLYTFDKTIKTPGIIPLQSSKTFYPQFDGTGVHNWYYASETSTEWSVKKLNHSCTGGCLFPTSDQTYTKIIFSDKDVYAKRWGGTGESGGTDFTDANFDVSTFNCYDVIYYADTIKKIEYISYEFSIKESEDKNYSYYDIRIFTDNYNEDYEYLVKFDDEPFRNISSYVIDDGITYQIPYNTTMYLWVRDNMGETIESKTFTFTDLIDIEEYDKPSVDINIGCSTNFNTNLEQAYINLKFNNYSTMFKYQYSFNDLDYIDISYSDIKNKSYSFYTHINTPFFVRVLDNDNNIVYKNSSIVDCIIESEQYYYYEFTLDDLYDKENNQLIFYTFYYENIRNRDIVPFIYFYYSGSDNLPFHITYNSNVIDFSYYTTNLKEKILEDISCTDLPYEFIDKNLNMQSYTSYTAFSFMPCIDLTTFLYGEQYTDFKLIIKSNLKLNIGEPIYFNGAFIPSTNKPVDDSNSFKSNFTVFFSEFRNAFNRFKDVIIEIFENCTYFFDNSNVILKDFYIVVFTLILFLFLIKFIL